MYTAEMLRPVEERFAEATGLYVISQEIITTSQQIVVYDRLKIGMEAVDSIETPISPTSLHNEGVLPLEYQELENDPDWEYVALGPIPEKTEWLAVKKDEEGQPLRNVMGSVVGRVRQPEIVIHPGSVEEKMVRVTTYVRWDPKNPNPDLLELGKLTRGATGTEVKIEQIVQPIVANAKGVEYTGMRKRRITPVVEKPQIVAEEHAA